MAPKLLEIDEIGYLPFEREETNFIYLVCFIKIVNKFFKSLNRRSTILLDANLIRLIVNKNN